MQALPRKQSLALQAAHALRAALAAGEWTSFLPGEWELCERLQIGRSTLRAALAQLEREGLLRASQGQRRAVLLPASPSPAARSSRVVFLTPQPLPATPPFVLFWVDALRQSLGREGFQLDVVVSQAAALARPDKSLQALQARHPAAAWVLYLSSAPLQQWFSDRALPAVIAGSRHAGIRLPAVDLDHRATCRHAVGLCLARGHRCLALVNPRRAQAGDLESEAGFNEGALQGGLGPADAGIVHHDGTPAGLCLRLDTLLDRPRRPTALLVSRPMHALTVVSHLARRGLVPPRLSVISRDDDSFLEHLTPRLARYAARPEAFARKLSDVVLVLARTGAAPVRDHRIMPTFVPGETLAPPCP